MITKEVLDGLANKSAAITAALEAIDGSNNAVIALPDDFNLHDLERYSYTRRRARGLMTTSSIADFAAYVGAHQEAGASVFIHADSMQAVAVLNLGTKDSPGHADNRAALAMRKTAAFIALLKIAAQHQQQVSVAEFLEDWREHIQCSNANGDVPTPRAVAAVRKITIEEMGRRQSEVQQLSVSRSAMETVKAVESDDLPTTITFTCVPYVGLPGRAFSVRLGIITGAKPSLSLRVVNIERHEEEMADELVGLVEAAVDPAIPCLAGAYHAS